MSYMKNLALDTRTCGQADEDSRLDRRDGLTGRRRSYSSSFAPQRRTREEWAKINADYNERQRRITEEMAAKGLNPDGTARARNGEG